MIPPRTLGDVFVKRLVYLFFYFFLYYYFNYELRGVIGRAMASHAIDPGSNPGQGVLVLKGTSDITACQCLALLSTAWQCLALLSTSGLVSGGARGAMAPPKF